MRTLLVVAGLLVALLAGAARADDPPAERWKLRPSDMLRYDLRTVTTSKGKEAFGAPSLVTLYGHDLRDNGQYLPRPLVRRDLPAVLALRLPATAKQPERVKLDLPMHQVTSVRLKGELAVTARAEGLTTIESKYTFASRGKAERTDIYEINKGSATVRAVFDCAAGRVREARVSLKYTLRKFEPKAGERPQKIETTYDLAVSKVYEYGYDNFQKDVDAAIEKGVAYLKTLQVPENKLAPGSYKPHGKHKLGSTALAVLTLASCGVPTSDPTIEKALVWLERQTPNRTYDRALGIMAFERCYPAKSAKEEKREMPDARFWWCEKAALQLMTSHASPGSWAYPSSTSLILKFDSSNTQYAVLGLRAAARLGLDVDEGLWAGVIRHCRLVQEPKGPKGKVHLTRVGEAILENGRSAAPAAPVPMVTGFRYATLDQYRNPRASMTAACITCLAVAREQLRKQKSKKLTTKLEREIDEMLLGGWAWLDAHWATDRHPGEPGGNWYFYYLYSLERAAILDRVRRVGGRDWYFEGAVQLICRQRDNGSWDIFGGSDIAETCFALLFLKRATKPVVSGDDAPK